MWKEISSSFDPIQNPVDLLCLKNILGEDFDEAKIPGLIDELRQKS